MNPTTLYLKQNIEKLLFETKLTTLFVFNMNFLDKNAINLSLFNFMTIIIKIYYVII